MNAFWSKGAYAGHAMTGGMDVDFDSSHKIIGALVDVLQGNFKEETHYERPMMPPHANIIYALDQEVASSMIRYMTDKLTRVGGFAKDEFRFTRKSGVEGEGLQRLRLEFTQGVTIEVIRKIITVTDELEKALALHAQKAPK